MKKKVLATFVIALSILTLFSVPAFADVTSGSWGGLGYAPHGEIIFSAGYIVNDVDSPTDVAVYRVDSDNQIIPSTIHVLSPGDVLDLSTFPTFLDARDDVVKLLCVDSFTAIVYYGGTVPDTYRDGVTPIEYESPGGDVEDEEDDIGEAKTGLIGWVLDIRDSIRSVMTYGISDVLSFWTSLKLSVVTWIQSLYTFPIVGDLLIAFVSVSVVLLILHLFVSL